MQPETKSDYARAYSEKGLVLARANGKMPHDKEWEKAVPDDPEAAAGKWSVWGDKYNIGIVLGPSKLICVEYDDNAARPTWLDLTQGAPTWMQVTGSGKTQAFYRDEEGLSRKSKNSLELRAGNHFHVVAPSIHPDTGEPYRWMPGYSPWEITEPALLPPKARAYFYAEGSEVGKADPFVDEKITAGGRHAALVSLAGTLRRRGLNEAEILESLRVFNASRCQPPRADSHLKKIAKDIFARYEAKSPLEDVAVQEEYDPSEYLKVKMATEVRPHSVEFLWRPFLQESAFQLLAGMKGAGKGTWLAMIAAQITTGEFEGRERDVMWIKTEDSFEIDVVPRFLAQEGNPERLHLVHKQVRLPEDIPHLIRYGEENNIGLIVIDPLVGTIGGKDTQEEGGIIHAIGGLNDVAHDLECLVLGVRHTGKNPNVTALDKVLGSVAWINIPRAVLGLAMDQNNHIFLEILAGNRTRKNIGYEYRMEEIEYEGIETTRLVAIGAATKSVDEVIAEKANPDSELKRDQAYAVLKEHLSGDGEEGQILQARVAHEVGCSSNTVWRAWEILRGEGYGRFEKGDSTGGRPGYIWFATFKLLNEREEEE